MGNQSRKAGRTNNLKTRNTQLFQTPKPTKTPLMRMVLTQVGIFSFRARHSIGGARSSRGFAQAAPSDAQFRLQLPPGLETSSPRPIRMGTAIARERKHDESERYGASSC
jgi:hypothetical protein